MAPLVYRVAYEERVMRDDIPALPNEWWDIVQDAINTKLTTRPELFGKPLRRSLKGHRSLRVGDYRVVFRIAKQSVLIFLIAHRSVAYQKAESRIHP